MPHSAEWRSKWTYPEKIEHGKPTRWNWIVLYPECLVINQYVDIGGFTLLNARNGIILEEGVEIGPFCALLTESSIDRKAGGIYVKKNAKIGTQSTIMPGVQIGENALVGAYSLVKTSVPANTLVYGIPAKVIRTLD